MPTHLLLLRGVNVGGHNKLPMAAFRALLADLGYTDVRTYIQSGNAAVTAPQGDAVGPRVEEALREHMGLRVTVVVRSADELAQAIALCPYAPDPKLLHVGFLASPPDPARVAAMDPERGGEDRYQVVGQQIYVRYATRTARSKLSAPWFDRQLGTTVTARNWRTVGKLAELMA